MRTSVFFNRYYLNNYWTLLYLLTYLYRPRNIHCKNAGESIYKKIDKPSQTRSVEQRIILPKKIVQKGKCILRGMVKRSRLYQIVMLFVLKVLWHTRITQLRIIYLTLSGPHPQFILLLSSRSAISIKATNFRSKNPAM